MHGAVDEKTKKGRGGFTLDPTDDYKFKVPQLYNLTDSDVLGHGASFRSVRKVVEYKNLTIAQNYQSVDHLSELFLPLGLSSAEIDDLVVFLEEALHGPYLYRYVPRSLPNRSCFPVADIKSALETGCVRTEKMPFSFPVCSSALNDSDGDGWGWEKSRGCVVTGTSSDH